MNAWRWAVLGMLSLTSAVGCVGQQRSAQTALERENFQLEQMIYRLRDELDCKQRELDACYRSPPSTANNAPQRQPVEPAPSKPSRSQPRLDIPEAPEEPQIDMGKRVSPEELPPLFNPRSSRAPAGKSEKSEESEPSGSSQPLRFPSLTMEPAAPRAELAAQTSSSGKKPAVRRDPEQPGSPGKLSDNTRVERIALNAELCAGYSADDRPGDDGIVLLLEPRDAQGKVVAAAAPVSVVVLDPDPALVGNQARVDRWDLTPRQVASTHGTSDAGEGFFLELPWHNGLPRHDHLAAFVRYTTDDGRQLETRTEIQIDLRSVAPPRPSQATREPVRPAVPIAQASPSVPAARASKPAAQPVIPRSPQPIHVAAAEPSASYPTGPAKISRTSEPTPSRGSTSPSRPSWSPERTGSSGEGGQ
jgi:hypothetical protein